MKKYNKSDKGREVSRLHSKKRRVVEKATADGSITDISLSILKNKQKNKCFYCQCILQNEVSGEVHLDHYIPLSKGGTHTIDNVVWSCKKCNLKKSAKILKGK